MLKDLIKTAREAYHASIPPGPECPPEEILVDYVHQQLPSEQYDRITEHRKRCEGCHVKLLKMEVENAAWDTTLDQGFQAALEDMRAESEELPQPPDLSEHIAQYFWELEETGYALTGKTATVTKEQTFETEIGRITIVCAWGDAVNGEPAFIWLSWQIEERLAEGSFAIHFVHPETRQDYFVVAPEIIEHEEQRTFKKDELGFDLVHEKWAILISIVKKQ
jgi:hypothetical protein